MFDAAGARLGPVCRSNVLCGHSEATLGRPDILLRDEERVDIQ